MGESIKLCQFNVENLFLYIDDYSGQDLSQMSEAEWQKMTRSTIDLKPLYKTRQLADAMLDIDADIFFLNEIGGKESLEFFNTHFLKDKYSVWLVEGNSDRGIDIGYLVKKELPFHIEQRSHKNRPLNFLYPHEEGGSRKSHYFSRDISELRFFESKDSKTPSFICFSLHLKSKLDSDGIDPKGQMRRSAELKTFIDIYTETHNEFDYKVPILVGGDFNGIASRVNTEPEFEQLIENTDLIDVFDLAEVEQSQRMTQFLFSHNRQSKPMQLDYIFINQGAQELISTEDTGVYFYKSDLRVTMPYPQSLEQRQQLPSDHHPVITRFKVQKKGD